MSGGGMLYLSNVTNATNDYSGGTSIVGGGILQVYSLDGTNDQLGDLTKPLAFSGLGGTFKIVGGYTNSRPITLSVNGTISVVNDQSVDLQGPITGGNNLTVLGDGIAGDGFLTLSGTNVTGYNGTSIENVAYLKVATQNNLGYGPITFANSGGTLEITSTPFTSSVPVNLDDTATIIVDTGTTTLSGLLSGSGALTIDGPGKLVLSNNPNTNSGNIDVEEGATLSISADGNLGASAVALTLNTATLEITGTNPFTITQPIKLISQGTVDVVDGNEAVTLSGQITGTASIPSGQFIMAGPGKLILTNTSNDQASTSIEGGGTLSIDTFSEIANQSLNFLYLGGTLEVTGTSDPSMSSDIDLGVQGAFLIDEATNTVTLASSISGTGSLTKIGDGTLVLPNSNPFTGGVIIGTSTTAGGVLQVPNDDSLGNSSTVPITFGGEGGTLHITGADFTSRQVILNGPGTLEIDSTAIFNNQILGIGSLTMSGGGLLYLSNVTNATNNYSGGTSIVGGGILQVYSLDGTNDQLGDLTKPLAFSGLGGTFKIVGGYTNSRPITLSVNGTISVVNDQSVDLQGPITGGNNLTVLGDGIAGDGFLTLSGTNVTGYNGTSIENLAYLKVATQNNLGYGPITFANSGGILEITSTPFTSAVAVNLDDLATIITDSGNITTLSGLLSGSGLFHVIGPGKLVLTNNPNTNSGEINVLNGGTLSVGEDGSLGALSVPIVLNNATLEITADMFSSARGLSVVQSTISVDPSDTATWTGIIAGAGPLVKDGTGTLVLSGANTYGLGTEIKHGKLQITNDNNLGAAGTPVTIGPSGELDIVGDLTTPRPFILDPNFEGLFVAFNKTATLSGNISGSNDFTKLGAGTLVLTGANSYTVKTTITDGTLQVTAGIIPSPAPLPTAVVNNGALVFNQPIYGVYTFPITGSGTVTKIGSGILNLTGTSHYTGNTLVEEGTLSVNGMLTNTDVIVSFGATLAGTGSITGNVDVYGTMSPGNSIGTMTINSGDYTAHTGSTLINEINPTQTDLIDVTGGNIFIDNDTNLSLLFDPGHYMFPTTYTIAQATGGVVFGTFTNVTSNNSTLMYSVIYNPSNIQVLLNGLIFSTIVTEGNAGAVAVCVDMTTAPSGSDFANILLGLDNGSPDALYNAFNQMQPSAFKGLVVAQQNIMLEVENALNSRYIAYHETPCNPAHKARRALWLETFGSSQTQDEKFVHHSPAPASSTKTYGILAGIDTPFGDGFSIGGMAGFTRGTISFHDNAGHGNVQTGYLGPYAGYNKEHYYINASVLGQANWYETDRKISFVERTAHSAHGGQGALMHVGGGGWAKYSKVDFSPFINFDYIFMKEDFYAEAGANSLNLRVHSSTYQFTEVELGLLVRTCAKITHGTLIPEIRLSVIAENRYQGQDYRASLPDTGGCSFVVKGYYPNRVLFVPELKLGAQLYEDRLTAAIYYQGKYGDGFKQNEIGINLAWAF